jgi:hypothetical protein
MTVIVLPESQAVPRCSSCGERPVAWLVLEINGGAIHSLCTKCDGAPGSAKSARIGEFAVLTRALGTGEG